MLLDCRDPRSTLTTLSAAATVEPRALRRAIVAFSQRTIEEDPEADMPRDVLASLGADIEAMPFDGSWCFHGTRVIDPGRFMIEGVVPLAEAVDQIWAGLQPLSGVGRRAWRAFRTRVETTATDDFATLYRDKVAASIHQGPHALVVRAAHFHPPAGSSNYLRTPEIIADIALSFAAEGGRDLFPAFAAASTPCIVRWCRPDVRPSYVESAIWYLRRTYRREPLCQQCDASVIEPGTRVRAEEIAEVEIDPPRPAPPYTASTHP